MEDFPEFLLLQKQWVTSVPNPENVNSSEPFVYVCEHLL
jgi:uncharacterized protein YqcC (DUF446 family)